MRTPSVPVLPQAMLLVLALSLSACATHSLPPVPPMLPPAPPAELMTPVEPGSWSESAQRLFKRWLPLLTPATRS